MPRTDYYHARLSGSELDVILRFNPDVDPNLPLEVQLRALREWADTVQSIIDDSLEEW